MKGLIESAALDVAFKSGLIDELEQEGSSAPASRFAGTRATFLEILRTSRVVEVANGEVRLSTRFREALLRRDLLETKLRFSMILAQDLACQAGDVFHMGRYGDYEPTYLRFFSYDKVDSADPIERAATEDWVRYMTVLTKYESAVGLAMYDFSQHDSMMDVGGNSGEFVHQVLDTTDYIIGTVFDLPGVVDIGKRWNSSRNTANRVNYVKGNGFTDPLPCGHDLITFKGVLHDWPNEEARYLLNNAWNALEPGGTIMIFERSAMDLSLHNPMGLNQYTMLSWYWIFQGPDRYMKQLEELGAFEVQLQEFDLDLPWMLLTAKKPGKPVTADPVAVSG